MLKTLIAAAGLAGTLGVAVPAHADWYGPTPIAHRWDRDDGWHRDDDWHRGDWRRHEEREHYRRWRHWEHERHERGWGW